MSLTPVIARYHPPRTCSAPSTGTRKPMSRRHVLRGGAAISALGLSGCGGSSISNIGSATNNTPAPPLPPVAPTGSGVHPVFGADPMTRQAQALDLRRAAAAVQADQFYGTQRTNGDEGRFADYRTSFSKGLRHNELGEVEPYAFEGLLTALNSGENSDFEAIPMGGTRKLVSPQAAYKFDLVGLDSHKTFIRPAPHFEGDETAGEMGELYWKALCRDVPFADFGSNTMVAKAVQDLNAMPHVPGPSQSGRLYTDTVFRGHTPGDVTGPYISQFLFKDVPYGNSRIQQRYDVPDAGDDYMTDFPSWLDVQNGAQPAPLYKGNARYISDARALGEYVHLDYSYQAYLNAALILLAVPGSSDRGNLYNTSATQAAFASLGGPDILDMVAKAGNSALCGAWYQKWLVHRRARPEVYGGRLHQQITGAKDYGLPAALANSDALTQTFANRGSYLLPMAYPEGSPTHPSYPAGHACIAGACVTVLKAFFEESVAIPDPVVSNERGTSLNAYNGTLTVGDELNKLASNIALGRDWAGVHYRSDGVDGMAVGEQIAIGLLQDYSQTYREEFDGFSFTKFDGTPCSVNGGLVA